MIGVQADFPLVGDFADVRPINLDVATNLKIHAEDVPYLQFGDAHERCAGARLVRFQRKTTAVPCFAFRPAEGGVFCVHCQELFEAADDRGFFKLSKRKTKQAVADYKPGKYNLLHRLPQLKEAEEMVSREMDAVRQTLNGTEAELSASWPDATFKDVVESLT